MPLAGLEGLLETTPEGFYCPPGDFHVDPRRPVERAVVTHAHADHARPGSRGYLVARAGLPVFRRRLGAAAPLEAVAYGEAVRRGETRVSLHPAGHVLGSAQARIEHRGRVVVVSGDYKVAGDATCTPFEPIPCHAFVTESTFGLPVYRWPAEGAVLEEIHAWWRANREAGRTSVLYAYALGKAQRVLSGLDASIGPVLLHGAVDNVTAAYREAGVALAGAQRADAASAKRHRGSALVVAPISANATSWVRKFRPFATGFVSGWMRVRGARRRRAVDRGFVISDHADWDGLNRAVRETGCASVGVTHGHRHALARWLAERGYESAALEAPYEGEGHEAEAAEETESG